MSKANLLLCLLFAVMNFLSCGDSSTSPSTTPSDTTTIPEIPTPLVVPEPQTTPTEPKKPAILRAIEGMVPLKLEIFFPISYKNLLINGSLTLTNNSEQEISKIKIEIPTPFGITGTNIPRREFPAKQGTYPGFGGNCPEDGSLAPRTQCEVSLSGATTSQDVHEKTIERTLTVSYTLDGKEKTEQIPLVLKVDDRKELYAQNVKLGRAEYEPSRELILTNLSNENKITDIRIEPVNPGLVPVFNLNQPEASKLYDVTSFCLKDPNNLKDIIDLEPKHRCMVTFTLKPDINYFNIQEVYNVNYVINKVAQKTQFTVEVEANIPANAPKVFNNDFQQLKIIKGEKKTVQLRVVNPITADYITDLELKTFMPLKWDNSLRLDQNSSCMLNKNLAAGSECTYDVILMPDASDPNYKKQLILRYRNNLNTEVEIFFTLEGDIEVFPVGTIIKTTADTPELIKAKANNSDNYYKYVKRPLRKDAKAQGYSDYVINRIPTDTWKGAQHLPWSFSNAHKSGKITKLKDIVPDRIEVDGKKYIKLYHGTTGDAKNVFLGGAQNIDFGLAGKVPGGAAAFGDGFYLSADINESKHYACQSLAKPGKSNAGGLLLVIGIEDLDKIQGKREATSDNAGKSKDKGLYFATGQNNQFVFFENIRPHLKILKVIELPSKFYISTQISEDDGLSTAKNVPDDAASPYRCHL